MKIIILANSIIAENAKEAISESGTLAVLDIEESSGENAGEKAAEIFSRGQNAIFVGKGHLESKKTIKAFSSAFENPGIILFDAHPDCENDEDIIPFLVNNSLIKPQNIILVGTRAWKKEEIVFLRSNKIKHYTMKEISQEGLHEVCDSVMSVAKDFGALHISIDIDAVDPANAPAVDLPVPGGLSSRELVYFLQRLKMLKNLKSCDLFEINPEKDINNMTVKLGAKIIAEMC